MYSNSSPYNKYTSAPPKVFQNGQFLAYLTTNRHPYPRIVPDQLLAWAEHHVPRYG
jgi:hypothetical protein